MKKKLDSQPTTPGEKRVGAMMLCMLGTISLPMGIFAYVTSGPLAVMLPTLCAALIALGIYFFLKNNGSGWWLLRLYLNIVFYVSLLVWLVMFSEHSNRSNPLMYAALAALIVICAAAYLIKKHKLRDKKPSVRDLDAEPIIRRAATAYISAEPAPAKEAPQKTEANPVKTADADPFVPDFEKYHYFMRLRSCAAPFIDNDGAVTLRELPPDDTLKPAGCLRYGTAKDELVKLIESWRLFGIYRLRFINAKGKVRYMNIDEFLNRDAKPYIGDSLGSALLQLNQLRSRDSAMGRYLRARIKIELEKVPLLVPFVYDNEEYDSGEGDHNLHMTEKAAQMLERFVTRSEKPMLYCGMTEWMGGNAAIITEGKKLMYLGASKNVDSAMDGGDLSKILPAEQHIMHPRFIDNPVIKVHAVAAYTDFAHLRAMYPKSRVAAFTFDELAELSKEGTGIVIDGGPNAPSYMLSPEEIRNYADHNQIDSCICGLGHEYDNLWHRFVIQLTANYGWDYMINAAQYAADSDLTVQQLAVSYFGGEKDVTGKYNDCRKMNEIEELRHEGASIRIAGFSRSLQLPIEIIWHNQTRILQIISLYGEFDVIDYAEKLLYHKFEKEES